MKTWSFYHSDTGIFSGRFFSGSERLLALHLLNGQTPIEGRYDRLSQRVDLTTGQVVDYQPPQPDADHEWNAETKRWQLRPNVERERQADMVARDEMQAIELGDLRAMREALLSMLPPGSEAAKRLAASESRIGELRSVVLLRSPR